MKIIAPLVTVCAVSLLILVPLVCVGPVQAQCTSGWARGLFPQQGLGGAVGSLPCGSVYAMCVYKGEIYVGGSFAVAGEVVTSGIARWNGTSWQSVGGGMSKCLFCHSSI